MITLYTQPISPCCEKVKTRIDELAISYTEKSIEDENNLNELIQKCGKRQVPYLVDSEHDVSVYGEESIIDYLESLR
ncbi:MAG: glutathione S-transferase N-terminal domain-containing protein [Patescibacteria group bacterium]